jgi:hypothetical protein
MSNAKKKIVPINFEATVPSRQLRLESEYTKTSTDGTTTATI